MQSHNHTHPSAFRLQPRGFLLSWFHFEAWIWSQHVFTYCLREFSEEAQGWALKFGWDIGKYCRKLLISQPSRQAAATQRKAKDVNLQNILPGELLIWNEEHFECVPDLRGPGYHPWQLRGRALVAVPAGMVLIGDAAEVSERAVPAVSQRLC